MILAARCDVSRVDVYISGCLCCQQPAKCKTVARLGAASVELPYGASVLSALASVQGNRCKYREEEKVRQRKSWEDEERQKEEKEKQKGGF